MHLLPAYYYFHARLHDRHGQYKYIPFGSSARIMSVYPLSRPVLLAIHVVCWLGVWVALSFPLWCAYGFGVWSFRRHVGGFNVVSSLASRSLCPIYFCPLFFLFFCVGATHSGVEWSDERSVE
jgi:hypothetical protein